jgi:iron complex outermembrane receptor protein
MAVSCFAILMATGSTAFAQAPADAAVDASPSTDILVTATRRAERAVDVPVAVSSLAGEKLDALNSSGLDIRFLSSRVPSLQIESSFGRTFPRFYIRGLGNTDFDPNSAQPVSVVYDDVALESPMLKSFPIFDLGAVEVLRGPQGTLFGRNTPAGVIKLDSNKPGDTLNGHASMSWGTYNSVNTEMAVGGPLGGGFSIRVAGLLQSRDNWVTNTTTSANSVANNKLEGYRDVAGRILLGYENGPFEAMLNVHVRDLKGTPRVFRAGIFKQGSNEFVAGFDPSKVSLDGYTSQKLSQWGTNLHLSYKLDSLGTISSITAYEEAKVSSTGDIDGGDNYVFPPLGLNNALFSSNTGGTTKPHEFSQELRFVSEDMNGITLQSGLYYFQQRLAYTELSYPLGGGASTQLIQHNNKNQNYGIYASASYKATDALTLRGGLRYSHDEKTDRVSGYGPTSTGIVLPIQQSVSGSAVTWDVSATYALQPSLNIYARAASGYLGPAIQDRVTFGSQQTTAKKQNTISGEVGIKGALGRGNSFSLDAYYFRTNDLQLTAVGGATNSARLINADHAVGYGVEAEFATRPIQGLELTASGSYNFTQIRDPNIGIAPCGSGQCTVLDPVVNGLAIIDGNPLPQAPKWVANATLRYGIPIGSGEAFVFTDWAYRSEINYFLYDAAEFRGRALLEGGLRAGYKFDTGLEVAAFARNITNQIRAISAIDFNNLTGMINEPRIIGGEIKFAF